MKILAINGSYRKNGNTARIIEMVLSHMQAQAPANGKLLEFEVIHPGYMEIRTCRGCRVCFNKGESKCPLKDDLLLIREKMHAADGVIIATPVYVNDVSGIIKTWMDRLAFVCHRPEFAAKHAYLIATAGIGSSSHALKTLNMALSTWGFSVVGQDSFKMGALMGKEQAQSRFRAKTKKVAEKFLTALTHEKSLIPSFISLMTFRIQQDFWWRKPQPGTIDYDYWKNQGWMNPKRDYYVKHNANRLKVNFARFVGACLAPFVT